MIIDNSKNISFSSRNKVIRFADDIARIPNCWAPHISSTKYEGLNHSNTFKDAIISIESDIVDLRKKQELKSKFIKWFFVKKIKNIVEPIKNLKIGNCGESTELAAIVARVNGIKNISISSLRTPFGECFDHSVLLVNDKKPYIIDSWLGFADYVPNAIKRYQKEFRNYFDFKKLGTEKMVVVPYKRGNFYGDFKFLNRDFTPREIEKIIKIYPEIVVNVNKHSAL